jgi:hypothetical protein
MDSANKQKRRVGVTAGLRQTVANQATGETQVVAEMAAPPEMRTPMGTAAEGCNPSADGSMATVALESGSRRPSEEQSKAGELASRERMLPADRTQGRRAGGAHEALPHTPPGGKPHKR